MADDTVIEAVHDRIIAWYAGRYASPSWPKADLYQEGIVAYLACRAEDPAPAHWVAAARFRMLACRQRMKQMCGERRAPAPEVSFGLLPPETQALLVERRQRLLRALAALPPREATVMRLYYLEDQTVQAIGAHLGLHHTGVSRALRRARTAVCDALEGDVHPVRDAMPTCPYGHPWTPANTYVMPTPVRGGYHQRTCRTCNRVRQRQRSRTRHAHRGKEHAGSKSAPVAPELSDLTSSH